MRLRDSTPANVVRWAINFRGQRRAIARRFLFDALGRVTPVVAVDTGGLRLYLSTSDRGVSRSTFARGIHERRLLSRVVTELERIGAPGLEQRAFLDIGANIGTASCLALSSFGASRSWAFEPSPQNVRLLTQNVIANGLDDRVSVHACALSDQSGSVRFQLSAVNWGDHRVQVIDKRALPRPTLDEVDRLSIEVPTHRLDDLIRDGTVDLQSVGLAWIDVQGHEAHVLDGALELLASRVPIVCEYWPYGLRRAASLERFHALVARERASFMDLGAPTGPLRPTAELDELARDYPNDTFTDLLLLPSGYR